jgi:peptidoglycan/LPS O-acetylase OafA/YrhL
MIHTLILSIYKKHCPLVEYNQYVAMIIYVALLLVASHILSKYFEKPVAKAIQKRFMK